MRCFFFGGDRIAAVTGRTSELLRIFTVIKLVERPGIAESVHRLDLAVTVKTAFGGFGRRCITRRVGRVIDPLGACAKDNFHHKDTKAHSKNRKPNGQPSCCIRLCDLVYLWLHASRKQISPARTSKTVACSG